MITWMQRHRKYLVVTIWISTIAFIGAGFVGWGQYNYGAKSGAIATVGDVSITQRELQQAYGRLFEQYSQVFQGNFDQEQAEKMGLDKQALRQLINEALLLNLANSYHLEATDEEVAEILGQQQAFFEKGAFSKELYVKVLKQNGLTTAEYESDLRKAILVQKVMALFEVHADAIELEAYETALGISDKLACMILTDDMISVDVSDAVVEPYWEQHKNSYMTPKQYNITYFFQETVDSGADDAALQEYYDAHKNDFAGPDGKLLPFETAKSSVKAALDDKAANKEALRAYVAFKKEQLPETVTLETETITAASPRFSRDTMSALAGIDPAQPYMKPKKEGDRYVVIKLNETIAPAPMAFADAKAAVTADYLRDIKAQKRAEEAAKLLETFQGTESTEYLTRESTTGIEGLDPNETRELLSAIFQSTNATGSVPLATGKTVLYRIVDQKIDAATGMDPQAMKQALLQSKNALLNQGLLKQLSQQYQAQTYLQGM